MKRSEQLVVIEHLAPSGEGVAKVQGRALRVAGALPGERVRVALEGGHAELVSVVEPSPERVEPRCPVVEACGGCEWQHASRALQSRARLDLVRRALAPSLRAVEPVWHPAPEPFGYRTRARVAWVRGQGRAIVGLRSRRSRKVVDVPSCAVLDPRLDAALEPLRAVLDAVGNEGEVSLGLGAEGRPVVSIHPSGPLSRNAYGAPEALVARGFAGAALWPPGATAAATAGDPRPIVRGADGRPLVLAPEGFAQANEGFNTELARHVCAQAAPEGKAVGTLVELYAGAGNFTVLLAGVARKVVAVESDRGACLALRANLAARELRHVTVREETAEQALATARGEVVVLDPPRTGAREVSERLVEGEAKRVVYVSCDPPTLGRDLGALSSAYELVSLDAFEMFPQTPHVEVVAVLVRARRARG